MTKNNKPSHASLSRRDLLKLWAVMGVGATGAYLLYEYQPWQNYEGQILLSRRPLQKTSLEFTEMPELVRYASLAASGHNTQPWKFKVRDNVLEIHPDLSRRLPAVDPSDRELWISLGCALENLLIAAKAVGYAPEVTYPDTAKFINIRLTPDSRQESPLFKAIPLRQNTRSLYDGKPVGSAALERIQAIPLEPGVRLHFVLERADLETVLEYVSAGNLVQFADQEFVSELTHWLRFTQKEALASQDGLYSGASGNPQVPRWLGQRVVSGTRPQGQADTDAKKLRSSSGAVVVVSTSDDKTAWVRAGQVYQRLALELTALNIKSAFLNQPIEVSKIRGQFGSALGLGGGLPQLLVRYGFASSLPFSLRRPVQELLI